MYTISSNKKQSSTRPINWNLNALHGILKTKQKNINIRNEYNNKT